MGLFDRLFSRGSAGAESATGALPWDHAARVPADPEQLLERVRPGLPAVFEALGDSTEDVTVLLVDLEDARWQALLGFVLTHGDGFTFSPESVTGLSARSEMGEDGPYYHVPEIGGRKARTGIYAVRHTDLVSALCAIRGIPIPFIKWVQDTGPREGMFTVVYLLGQTLGVRRVSADATRIETPGLKDVISALVPEMPWTDPSPSPGKKRADEPTARSTRTIARAVTGAYVHRKTQGTRGEFAGVKLRIEPAGGSEVRFRSDVVGGTIPERFLPAIEAAARAYLRSGVDATTRVAGVTVIVFDGSHHPVDSSDAAFAAAATRALELAFASAELVPVSE